MSDEKNWRDEARERCEAASYGPWSVDDSHEMPLVYGDVVVCVNVLRWDAPFIAHARTDLPRALDTIDALARGRITQWHAEQVTQEMLRAYLEGSEDWRMHEGAWRHIESDGWAYIHMRHEFTFQDIASAEGRGELAVWLDVMNTQ